MFDHLKMLHLEETFEITRPWNPYNRAPRRNFPDQRSPSTTYGFWSVLSAKKPKLAMLVVIFGGSGSGPECFKPVPGGVGAALGRFLESFPMCSLRMPIGSLDV